MNKSNDFWLYVSCLFFVLLFLNVIVGKLVVFYNLDSSFFLGDVGEFLLLLVAVVFFVVGVLKREEKVIK
ncbi:MAG: hypothetical protein ACI9NY_000908 [Kiritimatiellia bacterium]|jgi:hypothetical protein